MLYCWPLKCRPPWPLAKCSPIYAPTKESLSFALARDLTQRYCSVSPSRANLAGVEGGWQVIGLLEPESVPVVV